MMIWNNFSLVVEWIFWIYLCFDGKASNNLQKQIHNHFSDWPTTIIIKPSSSFEINDRIMMNAGWIAIFTTTTILFTLLLLLLFSSKPNNKKHLRLFFFLNDDNDHDDGDGDGDEENHFWNIFERTWKLNFYFFFVHFDSITHFIFWM